MDYRLDILVESHGIPEEVIHNTINIAKKYFELPESTKMEVSNANFQLR